jgi:peroxin-19
MTDPNIDMDAILDEALDELDDDDDSEHDTDNAAAGDNPLLTPQHADRQDVDSVSEQTNSEEDIIEDSKSPAAVFQNMLRDFIEADDDGADPNKRLGQFMDQVQAQLPPEEDEDENDIPDGEDENPKEGIEQTIAAILEEMSKANLGDVPDIDAKDFDFDAENLNPDALIDGMMQQLLSKDLMYEPMKQVSEKFPAWLEENKASLPADDYDQ